MLDVPVQSDRAPTDAGRGPLPMRGAILAAVANASNSREPAARLENLLFDCEEQRVAPITITRPAREVDDELRSPSRTRLHGALR